MQKILLTALLLCTANRLSGQVPTMYLAEEARLDARHIRGITPLPIERLLVLPGDTMLVMGGGAPLPKMFDMKASINSWNANLMPTMRTQFMGVGRMGILGNRVWVDDRSNQQVVQLDHAGTVVTAAPLPTWVRPHWADRHKFPLMGGMDVVALYANGTMLVQPTKPRTLFDTPGYKRSLTHLLLIEPGGAVEREIAQFDPWSHRVELYQPIKRNLFTALAPWSMGDRWHVASDGSHVVVAKSGMAPSDSGKIRVTSISAHGDTLFSRQYRAVAIPVTRAAVDSALAKYHEFGDFTAAQVRDSVRARIPAYRAMMTSVLTSPSATWLFMRSATDSIKDQTALVIDSQGSAAASIQVAGSLTPLAVDRTHLWAYDQENKGLVRFTLRGTPAATSSPQPRSASAAGGKKPASQ